MKKAGLFLGMAVLILSFGLAFVSCDDDNGNGGGGGGNTVEVTFNITNNYTSPINKVRFQSDREPYNTEINTTIAANGGTGQVKINITKGSSGEYSGDLNVYYTDNASTGTRRIVGTTQTSWNVTTTEHSTNLD